MTGRKTPFPPCYTPGSWQTTFARDSSARRNSLGRFRSFFQERGYIEVDTPTLSPFLIPEPSIEVFQTSFHSASGRELPLWLIPSPELWMKRLLAAGSGKSSR